MFDVTLHGRYVVKDFRSWCSFKVTLVTLVGFLLDHVFLMYLEITDELAEALGYK